MSHPPRLAADGQPVIADHCLINPVPGWICLIIGLVLILIPFPLFYIYLPVLLIALVWSIVLIANNRLAQGLTMLTLTCTLPIFFWIVGIAMFAALLNVVLEAAPLNIH